ncbi:unnamed protein product, partial [Linum tenue]
QITALNKTQRRFFSSGQIDDSQSPSSNLGLRKSRSYSFGAFLLDDDGQSNFPFQSIEDSRRVYPCEASGWRRPSSSVIMCPRSRSATSSTTKIWPRHRNSSAQSLSANWSMLFFDSGKLYDEYAARRNERLRKKKICEGGGMILPSERNVRRRRRSAEERAAAEEESSVNEILII